MFSMKEEFERLGENILLRSGENILFCFAANGILKKLGFWGASLLFQLLIVALSVSIFKIKNNKKVRGSNNIFSWIFQILQK